MEPQTEKNNEENYKQRSVALNTRSDISTYGALLGFSETVYLLVIIQ